MNRIQLVGISGDQRYEAWKVSVRQAIKELRFEVELEEINTVDGIIDSKASVIPALAFNSTILLEQNSHIPDSKEIKDHIMAHLESNQFKVQHIIVPTDFSENAQNAYDYAEQMAKTTGAHLKVVHICHPSTDHSNGVNIPTMEELLKTRQQQLDRFVSQKRTNALEGPVATAMVDQELLIGFAAEELIRLSGQDQCDLIIMGTKGKGNLLERWVGSVSSTVSQRAHCPVLLIPPNMPFTGFKNILYASNYDAVNESTLGHIQQFAELFNANVHLTHVRRESHKNGNGRHAEDVVLRHLIKQKAPKLQASVTSVGGPTVWEGLYQHARCKKANLIVLVTRHRKFWANLLHRSITKQMVLNATMPLLILHVDD
ncbi:MAG: universal stress protein [Bacteroidota bacterium]